MSIFEGIWDATKTGFKIFLIGLVIGVIRAGIGFVMAMFAITGSMLGVTISIIAWFLTALFAIPISGWLAHWFWDWW